MLSIGIIGLPNVGKSTLFNALTSGNAGVSNYPFTTIDSNIGVVPVPDKRMELLSESLNPEETIPYYIQFTDIAGLVRGASRGEGLGNQFLGNIRAVDAIAHVVRCFRKDDVVHVLGDVDSARDIDIVETELLLADIEILEGAIEKRAKIWKTSPRQYSTEEVRFNLYRENLAGGVPLRRLDLDPDAQNELKALGILSSKPILYVANTDDEFPTEEENPCIGRIKQSRISYSRKVVTISAPFEWEMQQLDTEERKEFTEGFGITESGLDRLVKGAFELLSLITFYTIANNKVQAWAIPSDTLAPQAAGRVHSDMEKGFIRAQVVKSAHLLEHGSFNALHKLGWVRSEGKEYKVKDGDVIEFAFSN